MPKKILKDSFSEMILQAHERSYQRAFETAVRTGTALIFAKNGKIVEVRPPFEYKLVPIKPANKKKKTARKASKKSS